MLLSIKFIGKVFSFLTKKMPILKAKPYMLKIFCENMDIVIFRQIELLISNDTIIAKKPINVVHFFGLVLANVVDWLSLLEIFMAFLKNFCHHGESSFFPRANKYLL